MKLKFYIVSIIGIFFSTYSIHAQEISTPRSHFGFSIGEDYQLANYKQMESYFLKVAQESNRVHIEEAGETEEGRKQYLLVISSPDNLAQRDTYRKISQSLGRAEGLTDAEARRLSTAGKAIVWIDGGMHSNEMVGSHQLIETFYLLASSNSDEIKNYLDKVIVLMWHVNPDGQDLMANWYMQYEDKTKRNMSIPRLYHKYVGHDNNRDFYMFNMKEASNLAKVMYVDWLPQIVYNHHQFSPSGTVVAGPPYRDPFNYVFDPLLISGIDGVGFAMINRLHEEDKPGYVRLDQSTFSTWWNGGLRTAPYYHNMIGILTEIAGGPTPSEIRLVPDRQLPRNGLPNPIAPQKWNFKKSIDYSVSLNLAILDYASRNSDKLLYNFYKMGKNSIQRGSTDHWTLSPKWVEEMKNAYKKERLVKSNVDFNEKITSIPSNYYDSVFRREANKDPRAYILSADQSDFGTAIKFVNALLKSGIYVYQASSSFDINGKLYPKNSIIIKTNQAFRPHIMDMFEAQDHPHDTKYEGGPPIRPYDAAGWTLALQMGVEVDRFYEDLEGPFKRLDYGQQITIEPVRIKPNKAGFMIDAQANDAYLIINKLLKIGVTVFRDDASKNFYIEGISKDLFEQTIQGLQVKVTTVATKPKKLSPIKSLKIGLFDYYGGSMPSGWTRWVLEQYGYEYTCFYPQDILNDRIKDFDILLFIGPGIPHRKEGETTFKGPKESLVPDSFKHMLGQVSTSHSIPILKKFLADGGRILTMGSSTELVYHLNLPVHDPLIKIDKNGNSKRLSSEEYFIPTSILQATLDVNLVENWGMKEDVNIVFNNSPVFVLENNKDIYSLGTIKSDKPLLSGWAHGQHYLQNTSIGLIAHIGKGKLIAIGPEIINRAQSHGTFKLLFNQLFNE